MKCQNEETGRHDSKLFVELPLALHQDFFIKIDNFVLA